ncbi:MAG TPA: Gfo/Idh/MocA family oxidoreductase [Candidatus Limnocylindria bacterium]|nr:Gfo/Idh/MocA family oxidoreductase [Candidatus Limnocylindria bacterium]
MRVAVIGTGTMGGMHARLLAGLPAVSEVLVVDADAERAALVARDTGARVVSHDEAIDAADAVVVATPAVLHATSVEAAVARGVPVLCEKPLTDDLRSSAALVARVEEAGAIVEMGFQRRHDPAFAEAHRRLASGDAGAVHLVRLTAFDPLVTPRPVTEFTPNDAAPLFLHSSVHDFDLARWLGMGEVVEVGAHGSSRDHDRPDDVRGVETAVVTMRLANGALAVLEATWLHPGGYDIRAEVVAERAHLVMGLGPRTPADLLDADAPAPARQRWSGYLERFEPAYRAELEAFLAVARGERPQTSTVRDGHEALRIAIAATRAYAEHRTVPLAEI